MKLTPDLNVAAPSASGVPFRPADFTNFVEALTYAAKGATGFTYYTARGEPIETLSYRRLHAEALIVAAQLTELGLKPGDSVGIIAETEANFARSFCGALLAGLIPAPLPLPVAFGAREVYNNQLRRIITVAGARAVFAPAEFASWVAEAMTGLDLLFCGELGDLPEAPTGMAPHIPDPDSLAYLQFSSGTTGSPKGVAVTHRSMMANLAAISAHGLHFAAGDRGVSWLPLYHDMGLVGCFLSPIANQFSADLMSTRDFVRRPLLWLELIDRNRATVTYAPSFGYDLALRRARGKAPEGLDLSTWRVAGIGGDMIKAPIMRAFVDTFAPAGFDGDAFTPSYGMAETTLALSFAPLGQGLVTERLDLAALERQMVAQPVTSGDAGPARDFALCGPALPGHRVEIRNAAGHVLGDGQVGRIFAAGPSLMREYFRDPEATASSLADGWLDTGDLGFMRDGQIVITGRAKDLMIINGRNLWPQDIEWTIERKIEHVREGGVAAFSVTPDDSGARIEEEIVIVAECRLRDPAERATFRAEVHSIARATHGVDARVMLCRNGSLPRTSSGKLSRAKARIMYLDGLFDPALYAETSDR
ncbi:MAG: fatty acyl-AMP ligase [Pseudomonadota bacterium]